MEGKSWKQAYDESVSRMLGLSLLSPFHSPETSLGNGVTFHVCLLTSSVSEVIQGLHKLTIKTEHYNVIW